MFKGFIEMFEKALEYFREICSIPHGSGNTKLLSEYCCRFAEEHALRYYTDESGNVVIYKNASAGYEDSPAVILQGHLDMVCVKTKESKINFETDGLELFETEEFIEAVGTSLGGDDGIAVAFALAILESKTIAHPPLEVVFTTDEETGMYGAEALDAGVLSGKMMINIDSEEEGTLLVSCAGGVRADAEFNLQFEENKNDKINVTLSGLAGGHSGTEIDKGRLNAVIALAKMLEKEDISLVSIDGGSADNAIAVFCNAVIATQNAEITKRNLANSFEKLKEKLSPEDSGITITFEDTEGTSALRKDISDAVIFAIANVPNGVISMSENVDGLVQTSLNLGIIKTDESKIEITHALRSSASGEKEELAHRLEAHYKSYGANVNFHSDYPAWEFKENSVLQKVFAETYEEQYGRQMNITAIHAGLECGLFCGKIDGLDCVSMGPDIFDIHTTDEKLSKKSAQRVLDLLVKVLAKLN